MILLTGSVAAAVAVWVGGGFFLQRGDGGLGGEPAVVDLVAEDGVGDAAVGVIEGVGAAVAVYVGAQFGD